MTPKRIIALFLAQAALLVWLPPAPAAPADYPASEAKVQKVVIYPNCALVQKTIRVQAPRGGGLLAITGLSTSLVDDSVQLNAKGGGRVRIADVEVRRTFLSPMEQERVTRLKTRLKEVERELTSKVNDLAVVTHSTDFLRRVMPFGQKQAATFKAVNDFLSAMERSMAEKLATISSLEPVIADLKKRKASIEKEIEAQGSGSVATKALAVTVFAEDDAPFDLVFAYVLSGVQWIPKYEVRADTETQRLELNFFAIVRQGTGEDLGGGSIEFSTARPAGSAILPVLHPWRLDVYQPPDFTQMRRSKSLMSEIPSSPPIPEAAAGAPSGISLAEPEVRSDATSMSYVLKQKIDIPSDNQPHKILVSSSACQAKLEYQAVPQLARFAYLTAALENPFVFPLLEGELNVFLDGRFVSTTAVSQPVLAGEEMKLALGQDETIVVSHKLVKRFTERPGVFSQQKRERRGYLTEIVNGKARRIELVVKGQLPVSAHEQIQVAVQAPAGGEAVVADDGTITWSLSLDAGQRRELETKFEVTYPESMTVSGL